MINRIIANSRTRNAHQPDLNKANLIQNLIQSREIVNVQTLEYDIVTVCSTDIDDSGNFLLVGLSNGSVDLQGIQNPLYGTLDQISRLSFSPYNLHRVQWCPGEEEQFFSTLDNHNLYLVDPVEQRLVEKFKFDLKTSWSEWNPNDRKTIAVCGSGSQVRLVDISSGSSAQTIVLGAQSGLATHRPTRCLWSNYDINCLFVGDNEGYLHVYDTRHSTRPLLLVGEKHGQISGMSFTIDQNSIITTQGSENQIVEWTFDKHSLKANSEKFAPRKKPELPPRLESGHSASSSNASSLANSSCATGSAKSSDGYQQRPRKRPRRYVGQSVDAYLRCQFYVTDKLICCPVPDRSKGSKEIHIYDSDTGLRIKTLQSDGVLCKGVYSIVGLLPDSLVLYVGGRGRLRVWTIDEDFQRKKEEKMRQYHTNCWDTDSDDD